MRQRLDLSGYWHGRLVLNPDIETPPPPPIERDFYLPLPWSKQIEDLLWPGSETRELSAIVDPLQNQNFRRLTRQYSEGIITYSRDFFIAATPDAGTRVYLVCEGSNYETTVQVNGTEVGTFTGGHLPFEFDITDALVAGANRFVITVDNHRRLHGCPQEQFNWANYGGVYRPLYLEWRNATFIQHFRVRPRRDDDGWITSVEVELNDVFSGSLTIDIASGDTVARAVFQFAGESSCTVEISVSDPIVWAIGIGGMSSIGLTLRTAQGLVDRQVGRFGFREIGLANGRITVNREPVRILGAAMHEQYPTCGNSVPEWQARQDVKLLKNCGLNTVRTAHYPHARGLYDACDEAGILVIADLPCWQFNEQQYANAATLDLCTAMAIGMTRTLADHPSVVGWIVENESKVFEPGAVPFFSKIADAFRANDPDRLILTADQPEPPEHMAVVKRVAAEPGALPPPTTDMVDILGVNNYAGWYHDNAAMLERELDHLHAQIPDKPLLVTEFGAEAIHGQRSLLMNHYDEDYQAELICRQIREILKRDYMAGFILWLFIDYEASSITVSGSNSKGLVDQFRRPKLSYDKVQKLLGEYSV